MVFLNLNKYVEKFILLYPLFLFNRRKNASKKNPYQANHPQITEPRSYNSKIIVPRHGLLAKVSLFWHLFDITLVSPVKVFESQTPRVADVTVHRHFCKDRGQLRHVKVSNKNMWRGVLYDNQSSYVSTACGSCDSHWGIAFSINSPFFFSTI